MKTRKVNYAIALAAAVAITALATNTQEKCNYTQNKQVTLKTIQGNTRIGDGSAIRDWASPTLGTLHAQNDGEVTTKAVSQGNTIDLSDNNPTNAGTGWTFDNNTYTILNQADVIVTGNNAKTRGLFIAQNARAQITLDNATIETKNIDIANGARLSLVLNGNNSMDVLSGTAAAIHVGAGRYLEINGTGALYAKGGAGAAAIGGNFYEDNFGEIVINEGTLTTATRGYSGQNPASIGPGMQSSTSNGKITINGGTVTVGGLGLGAVGYSSRGGHVIFNGGTVSAARVGHGSGTTTINGGSVKTPNMAANAKNTAGQTLYRDTLTVGQTAQPNTTITAAKIDGRTHNEQGGYGIKDVKTDADGKLYLWLPATELPQLVELTTQNNATYGAGFVRTTAGNNQILTNNYPKLTLNNGVHNLDFDLADQGYTAQTKTVQVKNTGNAATGNLNVSFTKNDNNAFNVNTNSINSLNANNSANINVTTNSNLPTGHTYNAQLLVKSNAAYDTLNLKFVVRTTQNLTIKQGNTINTTYGTEQTLTLETQGELGSGTTSWHSTNNNVATVNQQGIVNIISAGNTDITVSKAGDTTYSPASVTVPFTVHKGTQGNLTITNVPTSVTYGEQPFNLTTTGGASEINAVWTGNNNVATIDPNTGLVTIHAAGKVTFIATKIANNNYNNSVSNSVTININKAQQPTLNITNVPANVTYGDDTFTLKTTGGTDGITVQWNSNYDSIATINSSTGEVEIKGAGNVTFTATKAENNNFLRRDTSLTIAIHKAQQPTLTIDNVTPKTYGDQPFNLTTKGGAEVIPVVWTSSADSVASVDNSTGSVIIKGTGEVAFTATKPANKDYHDKDTTVTLTISPATLTVTAADIQVTYLDSIPKLNVKYGTFVLGEDSTVLLSLPTATTTAVAGDSAGTYPISVAGGSAKNYTLLYTTGTLTIAKRTPIASDLYITPDTAVYTGKTHKVTVDTVGVKGFGKISSVKYAGLTTAPTTPGKYAITVNVAVGMNYSAVNGILVDTLVINKAPLDSVKFTVNNNITPDKALVTPANIKGLGTITVKFNGKTDIPTTPGEYKVTVDHTDGEYYQDATDHEVGTYTITGSDEPTIPDEEEEEEDEPTPPVNNQTAKTTQGKVWANGQQLFIQTERNEQVRIYTLSGQLYTTLNVGAGERKELTITQGFYVVVLDGKTHKVRIR